MSAPALSSPYRVSSVDGSGDAVLVRAHNGELLYDLGSGIGLMIAAPENNDTRASISRPYWPHVSGNDFYFLYDRSAYRVENPSVHPGLPAHEEEAAQGELSKDAEPFISLRAPAGTLTVDQINALLKGIIAALVAMPIKSGKIPLRYGGPNTYTGPAHPWDDDDPRIASYLVSLVADESITPLERGLAFLVNDNLKRLFDHTEIITILVENGVLDYLNDHTTPTRFIPGNLMVQPELAIMGAPLTSGSDRLVNECSDRDRLTLFFALKNNIIRATRPGSAVSLRASKRHAVKSLSNRLLRRKEFSYHADDRLNAQTVEKLNALSPIQLLELFSMTATDFTASGFEFAVNALATKRLSGRMDYPFLTSEEAKIADARVEALALACGDARAANYAAKALIPAAVIGMLAVDEATFTEAGLLLIEAQKEDFFPDDYPILIGELLEQYANQGLDVPFTWFARLNSLDENSGIGVF